MLSIPFDDGLYPIFQPWDGELLPCEEVDDCLFPTGESSPNLICSSLVLNSTRHSVCVCNFTHGKVGDRCNDSTISTHILNGLTLLCVFFALGFLFRALAIARKMNKAFLKTQAGICYCIASLGILVNTISSMCRVASYLVTDLNGLVLSSSLQSVFSALNYGFFVATLLSISITWLTVMRPNDSKLKYIKAFLIIFLIAVLLLMFYFQINREYTLLGFISIPVLIFCGILFNRIGKGLTRATASSTSESARVAHKELKKYTRMLSHRCGLCLFVYAIAVAYGAVFVLHDVKKFMPLVIFSPSITITFVLLYGNVIGYIGAIVLRKAKKSSSKVGPSTALSSTKGTTNDGQ